MIPSIPLNRLMDSSPSRSIGTNGNWEESVGPSGEKQMSFVLNGGMRLNDMWARLTYPEGARPEDSGWYYFDEKGIMQSGWIDLRLFKMLCLSLDIYIAAADAYIHTVARGRHGEAIDQLKVLAIRYHIPPETVYPHSFRHRFAKNFLNKFNDISLLADLMGHESIETTRIYLTKSSLEQRKFIDKIVTW